MPGTTTAHSRQTCHLRSEHVAMWREIPGLAADVTGSPGPAVDVTKIPGPAVDVTKICVESVSKLLLKGENMLNLGVKSRLVVIGI